MINTMPSPALVGASAGLVAAGSMAWAVRGRSSNLIAPSIHRGNPSRPAIALTFDDGPSESTPALLEILAENQVPATFFMCGRNIRRCPQIAREVASAGHEIGNHSDTHPYFMFRSPEFIYGELALAQETIRKVTGRTPALFRAPYGIRWFGLRAAQRRLALTGVMWSVIGRDWKWPAPRIVSLLVRSTANGSIICLHDGRTTERAPDIRPMLEAVARVIPLLKERGFQFQTVSRIL